MCFVKNEVKEEILVKDYISINFFLFQIVMIDKLYEGL